MEPHEKGCENININIYIYIYILLTAHMFLELLSFDSKVSIPSNLVQWHGICESHLYAAHIHDHVTCTGTLSVKLAQ